MPPADTPDALKTGPIGVPRVIPTDDVLRALPYLSTPGYHAHGFTGTRAHGDCDACNEVRRRQNAPPSEEDGA